MLLSLLVRDTQKDRVKSVPQGAGATGRKVDQLQGEDELQPSDETFLYSSDSAFITTDSLAICMVSLLFYHCFYTIV